MKEGAKEPPRPDGALLELGLDPLARPGSRCPHCLEDVAEEAYRCNGCQARFHLGCLGEAHPRGCGLCGGAVLPERRAALRRFELERIEGRAAAWGAVAGVLSWLPWLVTLALTVALLELPEDVLYGVVIAPWVLSYLTSRAVRELLVRRATRR